MSVKLEDKRGAPNNVHSVSCANDGLNSNMTSNTNGYILQKNGDTFEKNSETNQKKSNGLQKNGDTFQTNGDLIQNNGVSLQNNGKLLQKNVYNQLNVKSADLEEKSIKFVPEYKWFNLIFISLFHVVAFYTFFTSFLNLKWQTYLWALILGGAGGFGVTGGVHRLWTHRSYSATWQLRAILALCYSIAGQNTIYEWVRDHRVHHKFSETDADPHNANRGFFFSHVGWLMQKKHPDVLTKGSVIDMSDVVNDPVVQWHMKYFTPIKLVMCFVIPILVPHYMWGETWYISTVAAIFRYMAGLNFTWLVNSAAHIWGNRPYDKRIGPVENITVAVLAMGEGWHNYHHVFPWDYKAAELGHYSFNVTTFWIDLFAKIGWAYDLKSPSPELIKKIAEKHGDGSIGGHHAHHEEVPPPLSSFKAVNEVLKYVIHNNKSVKQC